MRLFHGGGIPANADSLGWVNPPGIAGEFARRHGARGPSPAAALRAMADKPNLPNRGEGDYPVAIESPGWSKVEGIVACESPRRRWTGEERDFPSAGMAVS